MPSDRPLGLNENRLVKKAKDKDGLRVDPRPRVSKPSKRIKPTKPSKRCGKLNKPSDTPLRSEESHLVRNVEIKEGLRVGQPSRSKKLKKPKRRFSTLYDAVAGMISDYCIN